MVAAARTRTRVLPSGGPLRRHVKPKGKRGAIVLATDHGAVVEARSLFPTTVNEPDHPRVKNMLKSGHNSRKIGKTVTKGRWKGMPILTLTLEERATCPRGCLEWRSCYGNSMPYAQRLRDDGWLTTFLAFEIEALAERHPAGFVVRLHVLGDFYSTEYVAFWRLMLTQNAPLRVFGFTAHPMDSEIGGAVLALNFAFHDRFRVRFSGTDEDGLGSLVIDAAADSQHVLCPAQTDATECCGTCGLCWTMNKTIEFVRH